MKTEWSIVKAVNIAALIFICVATLYVGLRTVRNYDDRITILRDSDVVCAYYRNRFHCVYNDGQTQSSGPRS